MRRAALTVLAVLGALSALVRPAPAQPTTDWALRWGTDQRAAHRGIVQVVLLEKTSFRFEYASGSREMRVEEELRFVPTNDRIETRLVMMEVNGRPMAPETPEQRSRREGSRRHGDPQRDARRFVRALSVLDSMRTEGPPEPGEIDGRAVVRIAMTARDPGAPIPRLSAWFDRETAALVQVRAFVGGQAGSALTVFVRYARFDGLDLPVRRYTEGSYTFRRREREYSSLLDVRSEFVDHRVERE